MSSYIPYFLEYNPWGSIFRRVKNWGSIQIGSKITKSPIFYINNASNTYILKKISSICTKIGGQKGQKNEPIFRKISFYPNFAKCAKKNGQNYSFWDFWGKWLQWIFWNCTRSKPNYFIVIWFIFPQDACFT